MPYYIRCANHPCDKPVWSLGDICPDCQTEAKTLSWNIKAEDTEQYLRKNEGVRRQEKSHWVGRRK